MHLLFSLMGPAELAATVTIVFFSLSGPIVSILIYIKYRRLKKYLEQVQKERDFLLSQQII